MRSLFRIVSETLFQVSNRTKYSKHRPVVQFDIVAILD